MLIARSHQKPLGRIKLSNIGVIQLERLPELMLTCQLCSVLPLYLFQVMGIRPLHLGVQAALAVIYSLTALAALASRQVSRLLLLAIGGVLLLLFSYVVFPENLAALIEIVPNIFLQLFTFFVACFLCRDWTRLYRNIGVASKICLALAAFILIYSRLRGVQLNYISFANGVLFAAVFFFYDTLHGNKRSLWLAIIGGLFIIAMGSRSSILYFLIAVACGVYMRLRKKRLRVRLLFLLLTVVALSLLAVFWTTLIVWLYKLMASLGIDSRTLYMIIQGEVTDLNGRDEIYPRMIEMIKASPYIGNGIGAGNIANYNYFIRFLTLTSYSGSGAHNGVLEMGVEFGVLPMCAFVIVNIAMAIRILRSDLDKERETILLILLATGICKVMIGSSYWHTLPYAMICGIMLNRGLFQQKRQTGGNTNG